MRPGPCATGQPLHKTEWRGVFCDHLMLIAAMNPCPCGYYGDSERQCTRAKTHAYKDVRAQRRAWQMMPLRTTVPLPEAHLDPDADPSTPHQSVGLRAGLAEVILIARDPVPAETAVLSKIETQ